MAKEIRDKHAISFPGILIIMLVFFIAYVFIPLATPAATNGKLTIINQGDTPTKPPNLFSEVRTDSNGKKYIYLSWDASTDKCSGIKHYKIYRNGVLISTQTNRTFTDYNVNDKTRYRYQVVAEDYKNHVSKPSETPILTKYNLPAVKVTSFPNLILKKKNKDLDIKIEDWIRKKPPTILDKVPGTTRIIYAQNNTIERVSLPVNIKPTNITTNLTTTFNNSFISDLNTSLKNLNNTSIIKDLNVTVNKTINNSVQSFNSSVNNSVQSFNNSVKRSNISFDFLTKAYNKITEWL